MKNKIYSALLLVCIVIAFGAGTFGGAHLFFAIAAEAVIVGVGLWALLKLREGRVCERAEIESWHATVMNNAGLAYYRADMDGELIFVDDLCRVFGQSLMLPDGDDWQKILLPHLSERGDGSRWEKLLLSEDAFDCFESTHMVHGGHSVFFAHTMQLLFDSDGQVSGIAGTVCDISSQKKVERELLKKSSLLDAVMNYSEDSVFIQDFEGNLVKVNNVFCSYAGAVKPEECIGANIRDYLSPQVVAKVMQDIGEVVTTGRDSNFIMPAVDSLGNKLRFDVRHCLYRNCDGEPESIIGFARALPEKDGSLDFEMRNADFALLETISHELRTPLAGIIGSLRVLEGTDLSAEAKGYVDKCILSAERFNDVVSNYLHELSGNFDPDDKEFISPASVMENIVELFKPAALQQERCISCAADENLPDKILCSKRGVSQALFCLMNIGMSVFPEQGITLGARVCERDADKFILDFYLTSDSKMTQDQNECMFTDCFKRSAGRIDAAIYSESGEQTEFGFKFEAPSAQAVDSKVDSTEQSLTVLLAEDDISSQVLMRKKLEGWGHAVRTASTGLEVLGCIKEQEYDLVLMDIHMPEMNGYEAIRSIREYESGGAQVPIVVMSAYVNDRFREEIKELGITDFVSKPIRTEEFKKTLDQHFKKDS
ncbi:response regulator [Maridesulfovibrio hydrothermalis]|uniref:histidine kinase n=1 Tax=Maridesulfovibrio hydrothermalis AM13 = DSM 14728 TaxID=1121451 RepID=L0RA85_9BACT|nr:response regulator [Maridesulfovibrio hydrothermalis]CCO23669.1 putative PAS/PAC sensor protein [Maridesulfovibrio hydrothermalis AM13 = DSM 14728]